MDKGDRIYVAGAQTFVGAALLRQLERQKYWNVIGAKRGEPDLREASQVEAFFVETRPAYVFLVAGRSGGIGANLKFPADLLLDNLLVACHVVHSAWRCGVRKLLYLASSCSYPRHCAQPMREEALLTGPLEPTNEAYAIAKIAGVKLCQAYWQQYEVHFISGIPANAFGPGDDFGLEDSHVIAALIRKMHDAKTRGQPSVDIWGSGSPRREFIYVDDLADACIFLMRVYDSSRPINIGNGTDLSIRELAELIQEVVCYPGQLRFDTSKPDGMSRKLLDAAAIRNLGWKPRFGLREAVAATYQWYLEQYGRPRASIGSTA